MISFRSVSVILVLLSCSDCGRRTRDLERQIIATLDGERGTFAVAFHDLSTGSRILINEHQRFHAASTMKTPVMIEVFKQAAEGAFSMSDSIVIKTEFRSLVDGSPFSLEPQSDSEKSLYAMRGKRVPIDELVRKMIVESSNLATNLVIELVEAQKVAGSMKELGAENIKVLRGVENGKAFRAGLNNEVTAYDLMVIYQKMAMGEIVSREACDQMISILSDQKFNAIIPARLPPEVRVAHKTGWIPGLHHDSGIVILPGGKKYVLVLLSSGLEEENAAIEAMSQVSALVYEWQR